MTVYYNEWEAYPAQWLRNLMRGGQIPEGFVCEKDIKNVQPADLAGFNQAHFFAGIGGWPTALKLAGWPDTRSVWTGSCPCQPFSEAGENRGQDDERHLWPEWFRLIREQHPATIFGEQVDRALAFGWLDEVQHDLESEGYAFAAALLPACSAGGVHIRERVWFVANAEGEQVGATGQPRESGDVADTTKPGLPFRGSETVRKSGTQQQSERLRAVGHAESNGRGEGRPEPDLRERHPTASIAGLSGGAMGDTQQPGLEGHAWHGEGTARWQATLRSITTASAGVEWIACPDGKFRAIKPGIRMLGHGIPARASKLRAYGNAIDPRPAAAFIRAFMEAEHGLTD